MRSIRRILVAIKDLRPGSHAALRKAAQIALACDARLELYHCLAEPLPLEPGFDVAHGGLERLEADLQARALARLQRLAAGLAAQGVRVSAEAGWDAPVHEGIVRRALKIRADLIVASVHAGAHVLPGLLRLTDWELVRHSPVPLLLVKSPRPYRQPSVLVALDPRHAFSKPLKLDSQLLRAGLLLSRRLHGRLHAVHAYVPVPVGFVPADAMALSGQALRQIEQHSARAAEAAFERVLKGSHIPASRRHLLGRHPIDAILQASRASRSAIVVMGAVSRSGLKRLLIGNTAERMLDELRCDVLIVKPAGFKTGIPRGVQGPRLILPLPAQWPGVY